MTAPLGNRSEHLGRHPARPPDRACSGIDPPGLGKRHHLPALDTAPLRLVAGAGGKVTLLPHIRPTCDGSSPGNCGRHAVPFASSRIGNRRIHVPVRVIVIRIRQYSHWDSPAMRHDARTDARTAPPPIRCDVTMGDMDGLQIVKAIRADPALAHIPFIMMMANPSEGKVAEAKGAGVSRPGGAAVCRVSIHAPVKGRPPIFIPLSKNRKLRHECEPLPHRLILIAICPSIKRKPLVKMKCELPGVFLSASGSHLSERCPPPAPPPPR